MKVAILSRPGGCFPNIISIGLSGMLQQLAVEHKIFYSAIPMLMRLLPLNEKPKRWTNNWRYRVYNKAKYARQDNKLLRELSSFDIIVLSECLPNALWKNYLSVETLRSRLQKPVWSYTDGPMNSASIHKRMLLDAEDYNEQRYDANLFLTDTIETKTVLSDKRQKVVGLNIKSQGLGPVEKKEFIALVDFAQPGYEKYREQQLQVLNQLQVKTIVLDRRYELEEIRDLYRQSTVFFMAFPETFGLPIAECLATGACVFTPQSAWPMAWRIDNDPMPWASGILPDCFCVYENSSQLAQRLEELRNTYDGKQTPARFFDVFINHYSHYYQGDVEALQAMLTSLH